MSRVFVPSHGPDDWRDLLADPQKHWRAGYSAMSAALSWSRASGRLPFEIDALFAAVGLGPTELLFAVPEWQTDLPGGRRASQTDIFALVRTSRGIYATGVEAKVAEPFGPSLGDWLADPSDGKLARLEAIRSLLGLSDIPSSVRYQLLHRTAAAVIEAKRFGAAGAAMIVQSFSAERLWLDDWQNFVALLGASASSSSPAFLTVGTMPLLLGWACCPMIHPEGAAA